MPFVTFLFLWRIISIWPLCTLMLFENHDNCTIYQLFVSEYSSYVITFVLSDIWNLKVKKLPPFLFQADVTGAYDTLPHDKLVEVILQALAPDRKTIYSIRHYAAIMRTGNGCIKKYYRRHVRERRQFPIITKKKVKLVSLNVLGHIMQLKLCGILILSLQFSTLFTFSSSPTAESWRRGISVSLLTSIWSKLWERKFWDFSLAILI